MKQRERVLKALRHEEPDRVPAMYRDVPEVRSRLLRDLRLRDEDELLDLLGVDFRWIQPKYVGRLCFSGGVDEQELLPKGSPGDVKDGVRKLLDIMAPWGGFFVGPTHNFQDDIPTENIIAMYEAARDWKY